MVYFKIAPNATTYGILMNMRPNSFDQVQVIHQYVDFTLLLAFAYSVGI